jgi:outer membrane lipoprotein-sorting protein
MIRRIPTAPALRGLARRRACPWLALVTFCATLAALPVRAAPPDALATLVADLAAIPGLEARFREEKHLALLEEPLVSEGSLYYARPDRLRRSVEEPIRSTLVLRGNELSMAASGTARVIDLEAQPTIRVFVESFRLILAGDLARLRELYDLELRSATADGWQIVLTPRASPLSEAIASVQVRGQGRILRELRVRESGGDETVTQFRDVDPARSFSERERDELFRISAP